MKKKFILAGLVVSILFGSAINLASAQSDAQRRQAAAEAYDRGTAAYLAGNYAQAAQWFETANRMAPAAAALMQAIRAHRNAGNDVRAATLALALSLNYADEPAANQYSSQILQELAKKFLRVNVTCERCTLDLDGALQEYASFFTEPSASHAVIAHFETGDKKEDIQGGAGESVDLTFEAPPPPPEAKIQPTTKPSPPTSGNQPSPPVKEERKPLSPIDTYIGGGVTVALGVTSLVIGLDVLSSNKDYEKAVDKADAEKDPKKKKELQTEASKMLDDGQAKQRLFNIFIGVTAGVAVGTAVIAIFFTDWSGGEEAEPRANAAISPLPGGGLFSVEARF